jgi:hypothetical protein
MNLTTVLDVVLGLSLIYLAASLFVTLVNEYISQIFKMRAKQVAKSLKNLINDSNMQAHLKKSPALAKFFEAGKEKEATSYVDPKVLAQQLVGGLQAIAPAAAAAAALAAPTPATMNSLISAIGSLPDSDFKSQMLALAQSTDDKIEKLVENISTWADQSLTMMGETYKKKLQIISFFIGLAVAVSFNLDTVNIVSRLYHDKEARDAIATYAEGFAEEVSKEKFDACMKISADERAKDATCVVMDGLTKSLQQNNAALERLPIGWPIKPVWKDSVELGWFFVVVGWVLTALATSLGAAFWFDLLNRVVNIRHGMRKPKVEEEGS